MTLALDALSASEDGPWCRVCLEIDTTDLQHAAYPSKGGEVELDTRDVKARRSLQCGVGSQGSPASTFFFVVARRA